MRLLPPVKFVIATAPWIHETTSIPTMANGLASTGMDGIESRTAMMIAKAAKEASHRPFRMPNFRIKLPAIGFVSCAAWLMAAQVDKTSRHLVRKRRKPQVHKPMSKIQTGMKLFFKHSVREDQGSILLKSLLNLKGKKMLINPVQNNVPMLSVRNAYEIDLKFVTNLANYFNIFGEYVHVFQAMILMDAECLSRYNVTHQVDIKIAQLDFIDAGFIAVEWTPNVGKIHGIVVGEEHRGKGVGDFLLNEVCAEAVRRNIGLLECLTGEDANPHAMRLFNRNGFENPIRVGTYPRGQRAVRLTKTLQIP